MINLLRVFFFIQYDPWVVGVVAKLPNRPFFSTIVLTLIGIYRLLSLGRMSFLQMQPLPLGHTSRD